MQPILDTIKRVYDLGIWVEIVTLLVPGFNDSEQELAELTGYIAGISADIPWHVTAFRKEYKMTEPDNTGVGDLLHAADIGKAAGLKFVYAGNLPGLVNDLEKTLCPACGRMLIERVGYRILSYALDGAGCCSKCGEKIPGRWAPEYRPQISDQPHVAWL
jgi:pyruvate formate lyase activating enzyme